MAIRGHFTGTGVSEPDGNTELQSTVATDLAMQDSKFVVLANEAKAATEAEHALTVWEAIKTYPKAVFWSMFFSTAVAMEGYDLVLIGAFYAFPTFRMKYGVEKNGKWQIPAPWQAGLGNGARVGEILGLLLNGIICDRVGFKRTMIGTLILLCGLIFIPFFAQNIETLEVSVLP